MKKLIVLLIIVLSVNLHILNKVDADINDYTSFAYINVSRGKLLRDYSSNELSEAVAKTKDRRFCGWRINLFNQNVPCEFISSTIFSMYNTGTTAMKYDISVHAENTVKTSISTTGTIAYKVKSGVKTFKNDLDASLKIEASYAETSLVKETENLSIEIDPNTLCVIYIQGTGLLTNGVARYYELWMTQEKGGFEYFTITNSYLRIEKIAL